MPDTSLATVLIAYDGSPDADAAITRAAELMPGARATVMTVWAPFIDVMTGPGSLGLSYGALGDTGTIEKMDAESEKGALEVAAEGAQRATAAGLVASSQAQVRHAGVAATLLAASAELDADVIVMGTRGRGGVKSFLLGSVSHDLVQHAGCAVLVVPSETLAEHRREWLATDSAAV